MTNNELAKPIVINLPLADFTTEDKIYALCQHERESHVARYAASLLLRYPTVYIVNAQEQRNKTDQSKYTVYVGETNNILRRSAEHIHIDPKNRKDWNDIKERLEANPESVTQYVIGHEHFNKSLTLDVENKLMQYMLSSNPVRALNNRQTNAQGDYFTKNEFEGLFSEIWLELHKQNPELFPAEQIIRDSALFKASPFHQLSKEQLAAEDTIMQVLVDEFGKESHSKSKTNADNKHEEKKPMSRPSSLIFVHGAAGTGKTVLLSHLLYRIYNEITFDGTDAETDEDSAALSTSGNSIFKHKRAYILVNHDQQVNVYNQIATKLGMQTAANQVVMKPAPFINEFSGRDEKNNIDINRPLDDKADIVLIDEAHLLLTQGRQGYRGKNMLHDILRRAKVVIAVFDPHQILQTAQQWDKDELSALFPNNELESARSAETFDVRNMSDLHAWGEDFKLGHIHLTQQFRIAADDDTIDWIDNLANGRSIDRIPQDMGRVYDSEPDIHNRDEDCKPYEIKVFDSPVELFKAIKKHEQPQNDDRLKRGLSRVVATYDWQYSNKENPNNPEYLWCVEMHLDPDTKHWKMGPGTQQNQGYDPYHVDERADYFCHPWNYQLPHPTTNTGLKTTEVWAEAPQTINEVGSTFSIQGFDLNFVGVIIGPSVKFRDGKIVFDRSASKNRAATNRRDGNIDYSQVNLRNELNVLLKRGVHGLYLFAVDPELQAALKRAAQTEV
ncbi:DUF2075 domain-containing protein [Bifidobacterium tsurumiense]|uniref:DUF2075 domain-containing protein n=1 Tax=Bifidobacterium tsurumiense TaxID=356829 RepID=UPI002A807CEB|nr:DUF2075 domain-containing protein [Bifidobacterium tsurumiense]MDY4677827.1 DUF2075 domain-containing protein [Bifidobacterium tsurumiense]